MTDSVKLLLRNKIANAQQDIRTYQSCLHEISELEQENRRLYWLLQNGPQVFGTLWREASLDDIKIAMSTGIGDCKNGTSHDWLYDGHGHNYSVYKCARCGKTRED